MINFLYHLSADQWAAIGQWVGALATLWAVIVSLRLAREAKLSSRPRLNIESSPLFIERFTSIKLKIINVGFVPSTIVSCWVSKPRYGRTGKVLTNDLSMKEKFPIRIDPGQACELEISTQNLIWIKHFCKVKDGQTLELILVDSMNNIFRHNFKAR